MTQKESNLHDLRRQKTRASLIDAYGRLVLEGPEGPIQVKDVVHLAGVGRSTFYEHFDNADELFMESIARPLQWLSDALTGRDQGNLLLGLLQHLQENRSRAVDALTGRQRQLAVRVVVAQIMENLQADELQPDPLMVRQLAEGSLALLRAWLRGEIHNSAEILCASLIRSAHILLELGPHNSES